MKKVVFIFSLFSFLFSVTATYAYTQTDVSNAQFLADKGIIVKQSTIAGYRLDSTITRAELVGIALKLKGVALPSYKCKGYFSDVRNNDWICRAVELAADNSLVTRANARFRAQDNITRAEALAIVTRDIEDLSNSYEDPANYIDANSWQIKIIQKAMAAGIINPEVRIGKDMGGMFTGFKEKNIYFSPNRDATRAEIFGFVRKIKELPQGVNNSCKIHEEQTATINPVGIIYPIDTGAFIGGQSQLEGNPYWYIQFGEQREVCYETGCQNEYPQLAVFTLSERWNENLGKRKFDKILSKKNIGGNDFLLIRYEQHKDIYREVLLGYSNNYQYETSYVGDFVCSGIQIQNLIKFNEVDVLRVYYSLIGQGNYIQAHPMRTDNISMATFQTWYKNVTNVTFREDTLKNLGDNTYEFLVDVIENGVRSTYKVKSKVNLENFTINNISSVKQ